MSEIVKEATAELAPVADAPAADAPTEETAADAMPSPLEASKKRLRKGLANKNCHLKYLEEGECVIYYAFVSSNWQEMPSV